MAEPKTAAQLRARLRKLKQLRRSRKERLRESRPRRAALTTRQRSVVLAKTNRRCHICGGKISGPWQADHVFPHSTGGAHVTENFLPAHSLCNNYRWDYSEKEFQLILKLGVWLANEIRSDTDQGRSAASSFVKKEMGRQARLAVR